MKPLSVAVTFTEYAATRVLESAGELGDYCVVGMGAASQRSRPEYEQSNDLSQNGSRPRYYLRSLLRAAAVGTTTDWEMTALYSACHAEERLPYRAMQALAAPPTPEYGAASR